MSWAASASLSLIQTKNIIQTFWLTVKWHLMFWDWWRNYIQFILCYSSSNDSPSFSNFTFVKMLLQQQACKSQMVDFPTSMWTQQKTGTAGGAEPVHTCSTVKRHLTPQTTHLTYWQFENGEQLHYTHSQCAGELRRELSFSQVLGREHLDNWHKTCETYTH